MTEIPPESPRDSAQPLPDDKRTVKVSKYLSKHLRHQPERIGLALDPHGWVEIDVLLRAAAAHRFPITRAEGLRPMDRRHVHLSPDRETATRVGARRGRPVVLSVDAGAMHRAGHVFHVSANGVWLTDSVPPEYLRLPG
uniref:RNA 2'-phosphotransferase n=1 Tax=Streptomyces sp. NBC_00003 TaxID=2903608 RepID=A0AAU2V6G1_9ACTN